MKRSLSSLRRSSSWVALALGVLAFTPSALGQSADEIRAKELSAKIKKDMAEIDALLLNAEKTPPAAVQQKIDEVRKNLDELLKGVKSKQGQVMSDLEELAKLSKPKKGGKGGGGGEQSESSEGEQQQGQPERPQDGEGDELKRQEEQKRREQEQAEKDGKQPTDSKPDGSKGEQTKGEEKPEGETGKFEREDVKGRWGVLPPKVAEQLQKLRNGTYPERYRSLIERYYRSQAEQESKKKN